MTNPFSFQVEKQVTLIGKIFGTPLAVQGMNWLPLSQLCLWVLFTWKSIKTQPSWPGWWHLLLGGLKMVVMLGSEWCHNIAHVAAACAVGQPVDRLRIILGMPVLLYSEPEHPSVTPRQHLIRSLGGPVCNLLLLIVSKIFQYLSRSGSPAREVADTAADMNLFLILTSLVPIPEFDGGPILKWSLISQGFDRTQTDAAISDVNRIVGTGLVGASAISVRKQRWLLALIFSMMGALCLSVGFRRSTK